MNPDELDLDTAAMQAKYEQTVREQQSQLEKEDLSDMVAEHAAKQQKVKLVVCYLLKDIIHIMSELQSFTWKVCCLLSNIKRVTLLDAAKPQILKKSPIMHMAG